ncbi:MAG: hypothetical protein Q7J85_14215 [Bacillota bacterium]|nr:hypothetical protein [Bacillota bacterium]
MKKTRDWFFAGLVAGAIGGAGILLLNFILLVLGIEHGTNIGKQWGAFSIIKNY